MCPPYRDLNVFSGSPTYVSSLLLSCLVTVAWYIMLLAWHCPSSGHVLFFRQLQFFCVVLGVLFLSSIALLWLAIICFMLGMQL